MFSGVAGPGLLVAALVPVVASTAGVNGATRRLISTNGGAWSLVYPSSTRPARRAAARELRPSRDTPGQPRRLPAPGAGVLIGYARCSTDKQDLTAQHHALCDLGVSDDRVYLDHGMTGRNRNRPGLEQALAAVRAGDTLVVPKLDRLARSVPDARAIGDAQRVVLDGR